MSDRAQQIFFEVFESLPRQGPGSRACAEQALALCVELPSAPDVIDLGCGTGAQTLHLAELTSGKIVAIDIHAPSVERLRERAERGLDDRIRPLVGDIVNQSGSYDLVWSEGALYNVGLEEALRICRSLLRAGGYLVFTEPVWRTEDAPPEVKAMFAEYPTMGSAAGVVDAIERAGLALVDHFTLPDEAWWDDFYTPMIQRTEELRGEYAGDHEALAALDELAREPDMHRRHGRSYAYELFVVRR